MRRLNKKIVGVIYIHSFLSLSAYFFLKKYDVRWISDMSNANEAEGREVVRDGESIADNNNNVREEERSRSDSPRVDAPLDGSFSGHMDGQFSGSFPDGGSLSENFPAGSRSMSNPGATGGDLHESALEFPVDQPGGRMEEKTINTVPAAMGLGQPRTQDRGGAGFDNNNGAKTRFKTTKTDSVIDCHF